MSGGVRDLEGVLPVDKPVGPSSHDIVVRARRELGIRRVGHTGTLDPLASGLLLVCLGRATRLAEYLGGFPKEYLARVRLGVVTTTDDAEGEVIGRSEAWTELERGRIERELQGLGGDSLQIPPAYSAKKVRGETAYARARRGEVVELEPVPITVHEVEPTEVDVPEIEFRVACSTGTYIRSLARDLGERLGVGAHLVALRRTAIGPFRVSEAVSPGELQDFERVTGSLISPLAALAHLPTMEVSEDEALRLQSGQSLALERAGPAPADLKGGAEPGDEGDPEADPVIAVSFRGRLIAVAVRDGDRIRPRKVFPVEGISS